MSGLFTDSLSVANSSFADMRKAHPWARFVVLLVLDTSQFIVAAMNGEMRTSIEGTKRAGPAEAAVPSISALGQPLILKPIRCFGSTVKG